MSINGTYRIYQVVQIIEQGEHLHVGYYQLIN